jgi:hypothetical protein
MEDERNRVLLRRLKSIQSSFINASFLMPLTFIAMQRIHVMFAYPTGVDILRTIPGFGSLAPLLALHITSLAITTPDVPDDNRLTIRLMRWLAKQALKHKFKLRFILVEQPAAVPDFPASKMIHEGTKIITQEWRELARVKNAAQISAVVQTGHGFRFTNRSDRVVAVWMLGLRPFAVIPCRNGVEHRGLQSLA